MRVSLQEYRVLCVLSVLQCTFSVMEPGTRLSRHLHVSDNTETHPVDDYALYRFLWQGCFQCIGIALGLGIVGVKSLMAQCI